MKKRLRLKLLISCIVFVGMAKLVAQEIVPLSSRQTKNNIHGNLIMTGNSIVGLVDSDEDNIDYNPNAAYNGNLSNGASVTAYIDIDNDDNTFSSSSADVNVPSPDHSKIVYAGLYWGATYYIERISKETPSLKINNTSLAGDYEVNNNIFTQGSIAIPDGPGITTNLVLVNDGLDTTEDGCTAVTNTTELDGNIAVIRRGSCSFTDKVINAQNAGAIAVIVVNTSDDTLTMSGEDVSITIPAVSINKTNGDAIIAQMETAMVSVTLMTKSGSDGDEQLSDLPLLDARKVGDADFRKIKFKVPGGSYNQVTAQNIIYDGYRDTPTNPSNVASDDVPYVCYAEVTNLIDQNNINGTYTVANMNATIGRTSGASGAAGGWTLVVIYENPLESAKFISTSDGFVQIQNSDPDVNFTYSGFMTPPAPLPVNARYGIAALEGDRGLGATTTRPKGDQVLIQNTATPPAFIPLGENNFNTPDNFDINPTVNFFNSSITFNNQYVTTRNPASENTLGLDIDLFDLPNTGNTLVANNQDNASFRLSTDADTYRVFLNAFAIEVATPVKAELKVTKQVYAEDGVTDVANENIELGDELFYDLKIENVGTENLVDGSITITEQISDNLNIISVVDTTLPSGVTYSITLPNALVFNIPATIVETTDAPIAIRYRVATVSSCEGLRDACSSEIKGIGTIAYTGAVSNIARNNTFGAEITNFLVNIPACSSAISFCSNDLQLNAQTGYDQYTWLGPGIATPIITTTNVFDVPNPQSGTYTVVKENTAVDGCMSLTEEFVVDGISNINNPILNYVNGNNVISTNCNGLEIPQILLCGNQDFYLETNFDPASLTSISWQRLVPSDACILDNTDSCSFLSEDCANTNWVEEPLGNGSDFSVFNGGDYRIVAEFTGGCTIPFYFSVFKNDYQPTLSATDIECGNDGSVTVINAPVGYEFSLTQGGPYSPTTTFPIPAGSGGDVTVYSIDTTLPTCEYTATINVLERNTFINVTTTDPTCINDDTGTGTGSIHIEVTDGSPIYSYTISSTTLVPPVNITVPNSNDPNFTFDNLVPDTYEVEVMSNTPNSAPGCIHLEQVTIKPEADFRAEAVLIAPATCDSGPLVQINVLSGAGNYLYDDGSGNYQTNNIFEVIEPDPTRTYTFFIRDNSLPVDVSACIISTDITGLSYYEPTVLDNVSSIQPSCFGNRGQVEVQVSPIVAGRVYTYQLLNTTDLDPINPLYTVVDEIVTTETIATFVNVADLTSYRVRVLHNDTSVSEGDPICGVEGSDFSMTSPSSITADINVERALSCTPGSENAIISISAIMGGSGVYEWSFEDTQGYANITTVPFNIEIPTAGDYNIYIRNQETGDCISSFLITIDPSGTIEDINFTLSDSNCDEQTVLVTPTVIPVGIDYTFGVTPTPISGDAVSGFQLSNGINYTFTATHPSSGCIYSKEFTPTVLPEIAVAVTQIDPVICFGDVNGSFSFTVENSTSFDYVISNISNTVIRTGTATTGSIFIGDLIAGTYTVEVTDTSLASGNCTAISNVVEVTEPDSLLISTVTTIDATDCGSNSGVIIIDTFGGNGNYEYELRDGLGTLVIIPYQTSNIFTDLASGVYTVVTRDGNSIEACEHFEQVIINDTQGPTIALTTGGNACYDVVNKASQWITITPNAADLINNTFIYNLDDNPPVVVDFLNGTASANTFEISELTPGLHTVTVMNSESTCISNIVNFTISSEIMVDAQLAKGLDCTEASIIFTAEGGENFIYDLVFSGTNTVVSSIITSPVTIVNPGTYSIRATDITTNCSAFSNTVTVNEYIETVATTTTTDVSCSGNDGTIVVHIDGATDGNPPYSYEIVEGPVTRTAQDNPVFTGLVPGVYNLVVIAGNGCPSFLDPVSINGSNNIAVEYSQKIHGCNTIDEEALSEITLSIIGGVGPYNVSYDGAGSNEENNVIDIDKEKEGVQYSFYALVPGTYVVSVTDANGCASAPFEIEVPVFWMYEPFIETTQNISCHNPESIDLYIHAGIGPFDVEEINGAVAPQTGIVASIPYSSANFELSSEGSYTFRITDTATGCTRDITHEVAPFDTMDMALRTVSNVVGCHGDRTGVVELTITGYAGEYAYHFSNSDNPDFVGGIGNTSTNPVSIDGFSAGSYTVIIDALEAPFCPIQGSITITEPSLLNPVFTATNITCHGDNDGTILITVDPNDLESIGTPPYSYAISSMPGMFFNDAADGVENQHLFEDLEPGVYTVLIQDANGCDVTFDYTMLEPQALQVSVTEITPESCHSDNLGAVTIAIDGGTPPYETNITNNDADFVVDKLTYNNLPSGTSVIYVRDANGCRIEMGVNIPYGIDLDASLISRTECATIDPVTGEIIKDTLYYVDFIANNQNPLTGLIYTLQGINGTPNPDVNQNLTGTFIVQPGEYKGSIESGNCEKSIGEITIQEHTTPLAVSITGINPTNPGDTGEIIVKIDQGEGPYMLTLDDEITVDNIAGSYVFNDVVIGNHEVKVYDMAGCASETLTVEIQVVDKNPIIQYADEILLCTLTNQSYPVIEIQDRNGEELNIPFSNIASVVWQKLDEIDCDIELLYNCPTTSSNCSSDWFDVSTDKNFTVVDDGRYRVIVTFANKNENNTKVYYYRVINNLEAINDELVVFPNPGREIVTINDEVKNIKLFNTIGKLVLETNKNKFNIIELEAGVYFARVVTANDEEKVVKLVKK
ncbi:PA domain-containing protein [Aquimarina sp. 2201CG1-2-11]|uniref:PA domain-containing protein n=1 Tax=Aquimarina discodermiae TaxID=3231043 RepID=UPI0034629862